MLNWLFQHDIVFICETFNMDGLNICGYKIIPGKARASNRGGVACLIKNFLYERVCRIDVAEEEQIWITFDFLPDVVFAGCYVAPVSSPYYHESDNAMIQSKCSTMRTNKFVIGGDMNAKFGSDIQTLTDEKPSCNYEILIPSKKDKNGTQLLSVCKDCDLMPLNNLTFENKTFKGGYTYREGKCWKSEVDMCMVSSAVLPAVKDFNIDQNLSVPSDHAPISVIFECDLLRSVNSENLLQRACMLNNRIGTGTLCHMDPITADSYSSNVHRLKPEMPQRRRQIRIGDINGDSFTNHMMTCTPLDFNQHVDMISDNFANTMYSAARASRKPRVVGETNSINSEEQVCERERWQAILDTDDDKQLWKAINWKGEFDLKQSREEKPSDEEFKSHFENLCYPESEHPLIPDELTEEYYVSVGVLDDPINPEEVDEVIKKQVKPKKSSGPDGVSPGLFKLLPIQWIVQLALLFNTVLFSSYPSSWLFARLTILFKKGDRLSCDNYRGINVINSVAKIYDYVIYNRLSKWWQPDREQAGAQPSRGCTEHLVTLRLLIDFCKNHKKKLFIAFIDFSKAYDRVPRNLLINVLKKLGCGLIMITALISMYTVTHSILGVAVISAVVGVRQGSPTSCFLFIVYVNVLIRNIKATRPDSFLEWLHVLMLMDDTVIFATTRERLIEKLNILDEYCDSHDMLMNEGKTKFMVINGSIEDKQPINLNRIVMKLCDKYVYLGSIFTACGSAAASLRAHVIDKKKHLNKLLIFLRVNKDMPFAVKRKVVEAAFNSAILYGSECWLNTNLRPIEVMYMAAVRALLGVRQSVPADICLVEAGMLPLVAVVKKKQQSFLLKMTEKRCDMTDDPLIFALSLTASRNAKMQKYIDCVMNNFSEETVRSDILSGMRNSDKTRFKTYCSINPEMSMHPVYDIKPVKNFIPEHYRLAFTRMRTSSHRLRIETGRWSRLPRDQRLCKCGQAIGDECHAMTECTLTEHLRAEYDSIVYFPDCLHASTIKDFKLIFDVLTLVE